MVVISVLTLLIALLLPALSAAKETARRLTCLTQVRSLGQASFAYATDFQGLLPGRSGFLMQQWSDPGVVDPTHFPSLPGAMQLYSDSYVNDPKYKTMICPSRASSSRTDPANIWWALPAWGPSGGYSSYCFPGGGGTINGTASVSGSGFGVYAVRLELQDNKESLFTDTVVINEPTLNYGWLETNNHYENGPVGGNCGFVDGHAVWIGIQSGMWTTAANSNAADVEVSTLTDTFPVSQYDTSPPGYPPANHNYFFRTGDESSPSRGKVYFLN